MNNKRKTFFFVILLVLLLCNGFVYSETITKPVYLLWAADPAEYKTVNVIANQVWLHKGDKYSSSGPRYRQSELLNKGIVPLKWKGGKTYAGKYSAEEFADYWGSAYTQGYVGIGIDEIGSKDKGENRKLAEALLILKEKYPSLIVAVWHAGLLTRELALAYKKAADIVMLENYSGSALVFGISAGINVSIARKYGIADKCIFALGINDNASPGKRKAQGAWSNSGRKIEYRFKWIKKYAAEMPGAALFAPDASKKMLLISERLFNKYFKE